MSSVPIPAGQAVPPDAAPAPDAGEPLPLRMPFRGYKHLGGLLAGCVAGLLAVAIPLFSKEIHFMGVGLCALGALTSYLLALLNRSLLGAIIGLNGGFLLGLVSYGAVAFFAADPAEPSSELMPRIYSPFLFAALCPLLGAGPLMIAMFFQARRPRGLLLRLLLATIGGAMAAAAGLVLFGMSCSLLEAFYPESFAAENLPLVLGFTTAGYVLFRLQVLFMLETASGDKVERPAMEQGAHTGRDDEP